VKLLGLELHGDDEVLDLRDYRGAVFVDNQGTTSETLVKALEASGVPALMVIDHREPQERLKPELSDVRRVGATATIYADYLEHGLLEMDKSQRDLVAATTARMHGLLTDTAGFVHANADDFHAAAYLSQYRDADLLGKITSQSRSKQTLEIIRRALADRLTVESFSMAGIGYLRAEDRDAIPQAADFLVTEENIHTAIVFGILLHASHQDETIAGSMRTSKITISPDEFIKEAFGKNATGVYYGGGRASAGGFEIPVGFLSGDHDEGYRELKWQVAKAQVKHKLLAKLGVEPKRPG
jgi:nanoRNase/pAp phosphatase (c-di-AMP/oligoRNAs hydrolase)